MARGMKLDQHSVQDGKLAAVANEVRGISPVRCGVAQRRVVAHLHRENYQDRLVGVAETGSAFHISNQAIS